MQKLYVIIPLIILFLGCFTAVNAQWNECITFGEAVFTDDVTEVVGGTGSTTSTAMYDVLIGPDAMGNYTAGQDGTPDIQIDIAIEVDAEGVVTTPGADCLNPADLDDWELVVTVGGGQINLNSNTPGNQDVCDCSDVWATVTLSFINGLMVDAQNLNVSYTSTNGASLMYETLEVTTNGIPYNTADITNYCGSDYHNGLSMGDYLAGNAPGTTVYTGTPSFIPSFGDAAGGQVQVGWWAIDDFNAPLENDWNPATMMFDNCTDPAQDEDNGSAGGNGAINDNQTIVGSAAGADCGTGNADEEDGSLGYGPNDVITSITYMYSVSSIGLDCNGDGTVGDNSSPQMNIQDLCIGFCPPCEILNPVASAVCDGEDAVVTVTFDESLTSGAFDIVDVATGTVVGTATGAMTGIGTGTGTFTITGPTTATVGVMYMIVDQGNPDCNATFMVDIPECMIICPDYTATISGGGQVCNNAPVDLFVTMSGGTGPYDVTLSDGTVITGYMSGDAIPVAPAMNTTYGVATVLDADGCPAMVAGMAEVMVIISCANAGSINGSGN